MSHRLVETGIKKKNLTSRTSQNRTKKNLSFLPSSQVLAKWLAKKLHSKHYPRTYGTFGHQPSRFRDSKVHQRAISFFETLFVHRPLWSSRAACDGGQPCTNGARNILVKRAEQRLVSVNVTPDGLADAVKPVKEATRRRGSSSTLDAESCSANFPAPRLFVKPEERKMTMASFFKV